ncbi:MAG: hypothetical protein ACO1OQ_12255 [Rufibacter sp.]
MRKTLSLLLFSLLLYSCQEDEEIAPSNQQTFNLTLATGAQVDSVVLFLEQGQDQRRVKFSLQGSSAMGTVENLPEGDWVSSLRIFLPIPNGCAKKVLKLDDLTSTVSKHYTPITFPATGSTGWEEFYYHQIIDVALGLKNVEVFAPINSCGLYIEVHSNGNTLPTWAFSDRAYWKVENGETVQVEDYKWGETMQGITTDVLRLSVAEADKGSCQSSTWNLADSHLILNYGGIEKEVSFCWNK